MEQRLLGLPSDRATTAIHVKKCRGVRVSATKLSHKRGDSIPTSRRDSITSERMQGKRKSLQNGPPFEPGYSPSRVSVMAKQSSHTGRSLQMSQQSSAASSQSESDDSVWSVPNFESSVDYSMTDVSALTTPNLTLSHSENSLEDSQSVAASVPSLQDLEVSHFGNENLDSQQYAFGIQVNDNRSNLRINTAVDKSASELHESPIDFDPEDQPSYLRADGTTEYIKSKVSRHFVPSITRRHQTYPEYLNDCNIGNVYGDVPPSAPEGSQSDHVQIPWCKCHWLLNRPVRATLEPATILRICHLYSRQLRHLRLKPLRRLQDKFEFLWQKARLAIPGLQIHVQRDLALLNDIFDVPPTITDGLITLKVITQCQRPPSIHGYIALALIAKAWLSLAEQQGMADVMYALFFETSRCVALMASSDAERDAYDILLQLLWQPVATATPSLEEYQLFCPVPSHLKSNRQDSERSGPPHASLKWVLGRVCRDIVDGRTRNTKIL